RRVARTGSPPRSQSTSYCSKPRAASSVCPSCISSSTSSTRTSDSLSRSTSAPRVHPASKRRNRHKTGQRCWPFLLVVAVSRDLLTATTLAVDPLANQRDTFGVDHAAADLRHAHSRRIGVHAVRHDGLVGRTGHDRIFQATGAG